MASATKPIQSDFSPLIIHYTDGTVHRLLSPPHLPPSPADPATGVASRDILIAHTIPARLYLPKLPSHSKLPILLYFHGGGFCVESAFSVHHHRYSTKLSAAASALILSVEYRLAPEHPLPAAYHDAWSALSWLCSPTNDDPWITRHGDFIRLFVGGDSAGGNIAHNVAIRAGSEPLPGSATIRGAILSHPYFWGPNPIGTEPKEEIEKSFCYRLWSFVYPNCPKGIENEMINPIGEGAAARLSGLGCKKVLVCVAEKDVLRGRAVAYAEKVKGSAWNGAVEVVEIEGEGHCFQVDDPDTDKAQYLIRRIADFLND